LVEKWSKKWYDVATKNKKEMRNKISLFEKLSHLAISAMVILASSSTSYLLKLPIAHAATIITVADTADSANDSNCTTGTDNITLREAFSSGEGCVNDSTSPDTSYTVNLTSIGIYFTSVTLTVPVNTSVTIDGPGSGLTTIQSTTTDPFLVTSGGTSSLTLTGFVLEASTVNQYVIGVATPFTGDVSLDDVLMTAQETIPLYIGAGSTDGSDSTGNISITNSSFDANNNGVYFGLMPGMFSVTRPHIFNGNITITNNSFHLDDGTGGIGASHAITFLEASATTTDIENNSIAMVGTGNMSGGIFMGDYYDLDVASGDPVIIAANTITGGPDFGGGITFQGSSSGGVTIGSNNISGNVVGANTAVLSIFNDLCLTTACANVVATSITSNVINVTASGSFGFMSSAIVTSADTNAIAYNAITLSDGADGVIPNTSGILCVGANSPQTCHIVGNNISGFGQYGIAGIVTADGVTQNLNIQNNLVHDALDMAAVGIAAQAADYGAGDPEGDTMNFHVVNNTVANVSNSGGGAIIIDTNKTTVSGDTVEATIFNNILESNQNGLGSLTSGGSEAGITLHADYNLVHTYVIPPGTENYFGNVNTGAIAAAAHDVATFANFTGPGDYSLTTSSPAKNAGIGTLNSVTAPTTDAIGTDRPQGAGFDMGAFELVANDAPSSHAGSDQYTSIDESNSLDCSGSTDPEDDTLTYNWVKSAGDSVTGFTSGTGTATRTFTPTSLGDYTFVCAVNDGVNPTATDTVVVHATAKRIAGASDRYDTAVKISQTQFPTAHTINRLVIASGENYPDALAAGPLAAVIGGPILLTQKNTLPSQTNTEITRVLKTSDANGSTTDIYVIGGTAAISNAVLNSIKGLHPGFEVKRIAGATDRVDTAIAISKEMDALRGNPISFAIASGYNSMDAAAIAVPMTDAGIQVGTTSNWRRSAVLLTNTSNLDSRVSAYLNSKKSGVVAMYIAGSTSNVSASAQTALNTIFGASKVTRVSATDHYDLPPMIASQFYSTPSKVGVTTGENFPDVLAAGPLAASLHMPLFYSDNVVVNDSISYYMDHHLATLDSVYVFGGTAAISNNTKQTLQAHL
jgi:putative cell wall-binding protein